MIAVLLAFLLFPSLAQAQELMLAQTTPPRLEWGYQTASTCTVSPGSTLIQRASSLPGAYSTIATLPSTATVWNLPPTADSLYYRVANACGQTNIVQYVAFAPAPTGPTLEERMTAAETKNAAQDLSLNNLASTLNALTARVATLETPVVTPPPAPTGNITATVLDADRIEIRGLNCTSLATSGTGLNRIVTCRH